MEEIRGGLRHDPESDCTQDHRKLNAHTASQDGMEHSVSKLNASETQYGTFIITMIL